MSLYFALELSEDGSNCSKTHPLSGAVQAGLGCLPAPVSTQPCTGTPEVEGIHTRTSSLFSLLEGPRQTPPGWLRPARSGPLATNRPDGTCCCQLFIQAPQLMSAACSPQATAGHSISSENCSVRDQCLWPAAQGALRASKGVGLAEYERYPGRCQLGAV